VPKNGRKEYLQDAQKSMENSFRVAFFRQTGSFLAKLSTGGRIRAITITTKVFTGKG
jgi:hypothetical protein